MKTFQNYRGLFEKNLVLPSIVNTAQICASLGIRRVVISPGSRNAPLTIAFVRHPDIEAYTVSDERSAAFIGLGMARQERSPVALVCTSGSAAYNYAPAVAEAYFQQIPLIIFTADRPPEWIDQLDGQTIRQREIYGNHVKASYELPVGQTEVEYWHTGRLVSQAVNLTQNAPYGPVHINVPIREPFYPEADEEITYDTSVKVIRTVAGTPTLSPKQQQQLQTEWNQYDRKLVMVDQQWLDIELASQLNNFSLTQSVPMIADIISNAHSISSAIKHTDGFLANISDPLDLQPDLLITFGLSVISKNLKIFLRKYRPQAHWHIQLGGTAADTFQSLSKVLYVDPKAFFELASKWEKSSGSENFYQNWVEQEAQAVQNLSSFFRETKQIPGEFAAVYHLLQSLPDRSNLHLANSMAVRYANLVGLSENQSEVEVFANRGTSGIDGSSSTAVGASLVSDRLNVLITGDLAFFYDRNALWHNYPLPNLRIVLLNNHAGGIFRMIKGPSQQPELKEYFETRQSLEAENTARDFGLNYRRLDFTKGDKLESLKELLPDFFRGNTEHAKLLEIVTDSSTNAKVFRQFKERLSKI